MSERPDSPIRLARTIGPIGLAASVIDVIIGSSIFVFPAVVAADLGAAGILPYLIAAFAMVLIALCFAESGGRVPAAGGTYAYVETAFGPFAAWVIGLLMYVGVQLIASAVVASVFVRSLSVLARTSAAVSPGRSSSWPSTWPYVIRREGALRGARVREQDESVSAWTGAPVVKRAAKKRQTRLHSPRRRLNGLV